MSFCTQCGHETRTGAKFCRACGHHIDSETLPTAGARSPRGYKGVVVVAGREGVNWKPWLFIGGVTILLVVILAVAFGSESDNPDLDVLTGRSPSVSTFNAASQATVTAQGSTLSLEQAMELYAELGREAVSATKTAESMPTSTDSPLVYPEKVPYGELKATSIVISYDELLKNFQDYSLQAWLDAGGPVKEIPEGSFFIVPLLSFNGVLTRSTNNPPHPSDATYVAAWKGTLQLEDSNSITLISGDPKGQLMPGDRLEALVVCHELATWIDIPSPHCRIIQFKVKQLAPASEISSLIWHFIGEIEVPEENLISRLVAVEIDGGVQIPFSDWLELTLSESLRRMLLEVADESGGRKTVEITIYGADGGIWKAFQECVTDCERITRRLEARVIGWGRLEHPNNSLSFEWYR